MPPWTTPITSPTPPLHFLLHPPFLIRTPLPSCGLLCNQRTPPFFLIDSLPSQGPLAFLMDSASYCWTPQLFPTTPSSTSTPSPHRLPLPILVPTVLWVSKRWFLKLTISYALCRAGHSLFSSRFAQRSMLTFCHGLLLLKCSFCKIPGSLIAQLLLKNSGSLKLKTVYLPI